MLLDPVFGRYFFGKILSTSGVWIHNVAAAIVVFELTGSAQLVGLVSIVQFFPQILLAPWSGAVADRGSRRRQLIGGRLIAGMGSAGLATWSATVGLVGEDGATAVIAAALVVGIGFALGAPAMQALIPALVRPHELSQAVALNAVPFSVGRSAGPAVGALLVTVAGPAIAFGAAAVGNLVFALLLVNLRVADHENSTAESGKIRDGLRFVKSDPGIGLLLWGTAAIGMGVDPIVTLSPSLADTLRVGAPGVGLLASSFGLGAAGGIVSVRKVEAYVGLRRSGVGGLACLALGMVGLGASVVPSMAYASAVIAGAGMTLAVTALTTQLHWRCVDAYRGRVMALWSIAFVGSRPVAAAINGTVADRVSVRVAFFVVATVVLLGATRVTPSNLSAAARPTAWDADV